MFHGSIVALVTPFTQKGEVDLQALAHLVEWHISEGTDGIVFCGTTGEVPTLSEHEQEDIFKKAVEVARGRIPLIAGTGTYDTRTSVERTRKAKALGMDGCLVIVPYYNRPTPEGCYLHYQHVAQVGLPLIVYHHPGRTGLKLSYDHLLKILKIPGVIGIKEASGDLELAQKLCQVTSVFSGDDLLTLAMMKEGGKGVISVIANLIPKEWMQFVRTLEKKDWALGEVLHNLYKPLCEAIFQETNPQGIKYALSQVGKCLSSFRLPLIEPSIQTQEKIKEAMLLISRQKHEYALL